MAEREHCPTCGLELPVKAPLGLCPACLLRQGLDSNTAVTPRRPEPSSVAVKIEQAPLQDQIEGSGGDDIDGLLTPWPGLCDGVVQPGGFRRRCRCDVSYSVAREGGEVEPLLSPQDLEQLSTTFPGHGPSRSLRSGAGARARSYGLGIPRARQPARPPCRHQGDPPGRGFGSREAQLPNRNSGTGLSKRPGSGPT